MIEVKVSIDGLEQLTEAVTFMASALAHANGMKNTVEAIEQTKKTNAETAPSDTQVEDTTTPVVPTNVKEYTLNELSTAAVGLLDKGLTDALTKLLTEFGVSSLPELDKSVYSQFALRIRDMGADI